MKKMQKILCMLLALAMLLSFAACAAKEAAPSTTDTPAADAADEKTETKAEDTPAEQPAAELPELTLMLQTSDESNGLLAAVDYVNAHAEEIGAKLILEKVPDGDQGEQVIQVRYAGGEDVPDILYFQPVSYTNSRLSVADNFVDLTANDYSYLYSDSYLRTPGYLLDGKLYNLPIATGGGMYMFYNKDVLAASGITEVPTTWDAFLADCEAIKANGISPVYYSGVDTWTLQFFALMGWYSDYAPEDAQAFADAMSTNQKHWSDMNGFIDSIGKIKELVDLGYVQETYLSDTYQQAQQALRRLRSLCTGRLGCRRAGEDRRGQDCFLHRRVPHPAGRSSVLRCRREQGLLRLQERQEPRACAESYGSTRFSGSTAGIF